MKKNYVTPEMEEIEIDAPLIMESTTETDKEGTVDCPTEDEV